MPNRSQTLTSAPTTGLFLRYGGAVVASTVVAILLHGLTSAFETAPTDPEWSPVVDRLGVLGTVFVYFILAYGLAAALFHWRRSRMGPPDASRGRRYGLALGGFWLWGMLVGVALFDNPLINELVVGIADGAALVVLGLLLGRVDRRLATADCEVRSRPARDRGVDSLSRALAVAVVFVVGRYVAYRLGVIDPGTGGGPGFVTFWTLGMGLILGGAYALLVPPRAIVTWRDRVRTVVVLWLNWAAFNFFMPLLFDGFLGSVSAIAAVDAVLLGAGAALAALVGRERPAH